MRALLKIDSFGRAIVDDSTEPTGAGFEFISGMDVHDVPGILKVSNRLDAETTPAVDEFVKWIRRYNKTNNSDVMWAFGDADIYKRIGSTWRLAHRNAVFGNSHGMEVFDDVLWYASTQNLGRTVDTTLSSGIDAVVTTIPLTDASAFPASGDVVINSEVISYTGKSGNNLTGATRGANSTTAASHVSGQNVIGFDDTDQAFLADDSDFHPMKQFSGSLFIGDGRYVAKMEPGGLVFTDSALTLPEGYRVRCLEVIGDFLAIGTYRGSNIQDENSAVVFFWDGTSDSFNFKADANAEGIRSMHNLDNRLYVVAGNGLGLYMYNGADFTKVEDFGELLGLDLAAGQWGDVLPDAMTGVNGNLMIGVSVGGGGSEKNGVYQYGRLSSNQEFSLERRYMPSDATPLTEQIGSIFSVSTSQMYVSWKETDTPAYGIDKTASTIYGYTGEITPYVETVKYEIITSKGQDSLISGVQLLARPMDADHTITVKYKVDDATSYTTLGTITSTSQSFPLYGVYKRGQTIQIRLEFTSTSDDGNTPHVTQIRIL